MSEADWDDWEDEDKSTDAVKRKRVAPTSLQIEPVVYDDGSKFVPAGLNLAFVAYQHKGKSLLATLLGYWNKRWWTTSSAKEGGHIRIDKYPKCKQMIDTGVLPEVEKLQVLDLDCSYDTLSKIGIFGRLAKPLYDAGIISKTVIEIPARQTGIINNVVREIAEQDIDITKIKIDNEIAKACEDNDETIALLIDSMSSFDELLNSKFRILYEKEIAMAGKNPKDYYGSSYGGIKQKYWKIRNGWWISALRSKRRYKGFQIDTYKVETKHPVWLAKELKDAKDPSKVKKYIISWAPKTEYDLDIIMWVDNDGADDYFVKVKNRFDGHLKEEYNQNVHYTPRKTCAIYDIFEQLAPSILGETDEGELDDIFGESNVIR